MCSKGSEKWFEIVELAYERVHIFKYKLVYSKNYFFLIIYINKFYNKYIIDWLIDLSTNLAIAMQCLFHAFYIRKS
jgi:hypothetical protein